MFATTILLLETQTISSLAQAAHLHHRSAACPAHCSIPSVAWWVVLVLITVISVCMPRGLTRYAWWQQQRRQQRPAPVRRAQRWVSRARAALRLLLWHATTQCRNSGVS
jgi:hypothetical protein